MKDFSIKYFPWAAGLPWKVKRGKYVLPEIPVTLLHSILTEKQLVVCAFGGFLESFYSLSVLEALNVEFPSHKLYWSGNDSYHTLLGANGLALPFAEIDQKDINRFPTPIFLDKNNRAYFNCLINYLVKKTYYLTGGYPDGRAAIQQIIEKSTFSHNSNIKPKIRYNDEMGDHTSLFKAHSVDLSKPFILFIPDHTSCSIHNDSFLNWNKSQNKSFITLATQAGYQVVVLTESPSQYWGINAKIIPFSIELFLTLVPQAKFLISRDVDFPLVSCSISDAAIIANKTVGCFKIDKNSHIIGKDSVIYSDEEFLPLSALQAMEKE